MYKKSTYGLRPDQIGRLFMVGIEGLDAIENVADDIEIETLLQNRLESALPKDSPLLDSLLKVIERLACDMQKLSSKSLKEILLDNKSDIGLLEAIKDYSKKTSSTITTEGQNAVNVAIYYAAIASSLVFHNKKISQHSYATLNKSFEELINKNWIAPELSELFSQALLICREKGR